MMREGEWHVAAEQPLDVLLVRQLHAAPAEEEELRHAAGWASKNRQMRSVAPAGQRCAWGPSQ